MMTLRTSSRLAASLVGLVLVLASCESLKFSLMKDDELVKGGIQAWNTDKVEAARGYWSSIKDPTLKAQWLGRLDQYDALEQAFDDAAAVPTNDDAAMVAGLNKAAQALADFPTDLKVPDLRLKLVPVARSIVALRIQSDKIAAAKEYMKIASDYLGDRIEWSAELQAIKDQEKNQETANAFRALDKSLDKSTADTLAAARAEQDFDVQVTDYETAITAFTKADAAMAAQAKANGYAEGSALAALGDKYRKRRGDTRVELDRKLRERASSFKDRIGEEFAKSPDEAGTSDPAAIVQFYEQTKTNIDAMQTELIAFAAKYPKVIDKDMLKDVDTQKKALEDRIVVVTAEWRKAQADAKVAAELASRGKPVLPLLIGLFNPVPGTKGNDAKSRPGKFKGTLSGDAAYWWGMVEIAPGTLNDLVVTVNDARPVRLFNDNTLSGKKIDEKKLKDLVNRQYKVGNSWPVINAGAQLPTGKYFFEAGKGKDATYSGDVVVYSSFIVRMR